jgi:hypothetical protein
VKIHIYSPVLQVVRHKLENKKPEDNGISGYVKSGYAHRNFLSSDCIPASYIIPKMAAAVNPGARIMHAHSAPFYSPLIDADHIIRIAL